MFSSSFRNELTTLKGNKFILRLPSMYRSAFVVTNPKSCYKNDALC